MDKFTLKEDVKVFCVTATSFPQGISAAHEKLHALLPSDAGRKFYGISYPESLGKIIYKAAVQQQYEGEAEKLGCESFVIKKGEYISQVITDYANDLQRIGEIFQTMLADPRIDPNGCCVEDYLNDRDMRCMIRLDK
jgi:hypothetical protein